MSLPTKYPLDRYRYERHPESRRYGVDLPAGDYVYVQSCDGEIWVLPDGLHVHPRVLGGGSPAAAAGELRVAKDRVVTEVNNCSGTFQFGPETLPSVIEELKYQKACVAPDAVHKFDWEY